MLDLLDDEGTDVEYDYKRLVKSAMIASSCLALSRVWDAPFAANVHDRTPIASFLSEGIDSLTLFGKDRFARGAHQQELLKLPSAWTPTDTASMTEKGTFKPFNPSRRPRVSRPRKTEVELHAVAEVLKRSMVVSGLPSLAPIPAAFCTSALTPRKCSKAKVVDLLEELVSESGPDNTVRFRSLPEDVVSPVFVVDTLRHITGTSAALSSTCEEHVKYLVERWVSSARLAHAQALVLVVDDPQYVCPAKAVCHAGRTSSLDDRAQRLIHDGLCASLQSKFGRWHHAAMTSSGGRPAKRRFAQLIHQYLVREGPPAGLQLYLFGFTADLMPVQIIEASRTETLRVKYEIGEADVGVWEAGFFVAARTRAAAIVVHANDTDVLIAGLMRAAPACPKCFVDTGNGCPRPLIAVSEMAEALKQHPHLRPLQADDRLLSLLVACLSGGGDYVDPTYRCSHRMYVRTYLKHVSFVGSLVVRTGALLTVNSAALLRHFGCVHFDRLRAKLSITCSLQELFETIDVVLDEGSSVPHDCQRSGRFLDILRERCSAVDDDYATQIPATDDVVRHYRRVELAFGLLYTRGWKIDVAHNWEQYGFHRDGDGQVCMTFSSPERIQQYRAALDTVRGRHALPSGSGGCSCKQVCTRCNCVKLARVCGTLCKCLPDCPHRQLRTAAPVIGTVAGAVARADTAAAPGAGNEPGINEQGVAPGTLCYFCLVCVPYHCLLALLRW